MPDARVTRSDLRRALVLNSLAKPVNILVPAAVLIACALVGAWWLAIVAVTAWLALAANTFFDEREAERVGERLRAQCRPDARVEPGDFTPLIAGRVKAADRARVAIHEAIGASAFPLADVGREVDALVAAIVTDAGRAQRMHRFLLGQEPANALEQRIAREQHEPVRAALAAKLDALARLKERLDALMAELDRAVLALQTMQAQIVAAGDRALEQGLLAGQVSELRDRVELVSAGLEEAFEETRVRR
jgi:hypothetical protein